ncbi:HD domain-containing protein [Ruminococcus sp. Marseille-P6503]|uniref:CCA tRNA nucleotidyltransferase n=1 Tax=Ruminococcus sp. Marseille-P6503 TaxID=2364796 RepID=UPI000F54049F|nr:HD domain-containing protein [Ruminococcus sp. Marseille-P6503]
MEINVPDYVLAAIGLLEANGYEAYCVGGCVRDSLIGRKPSDWDICTDALPFQLQQVFSGCKTVDTGLKHGTLTVIIDGNAVEITTYRSDGSYADHRRPDRVEFIRELKRDLERRDFTINAMCYNPKSGLTDIFGGADDLKSKIIRCVGDPVRRFSEDSLRILRAVRFSSVLGFSIENDTKRAVFSEKELLRYISPERIFSELKKLVCGKNASEALSEYGEIIAVFIPEIIPCFGFPQNNPHHCFDVWEHICRSVGFCRPQTELRLTMLLHDVAKPKTATTDANGINHFKTHQFAGAEISSEILRRLRCGNAAVKHIHDLIYEHDNRIPAERKAVRRFISKYGFDFFMDYLEVRRADTYAQSDYKRKEKLKNLDLLAVIALELEEENACMKISDLNVNGNDLIALGLRGQQIGAALRQILEAVISEEISNDKNQIAEYVRKVIL